MKNLAIIPARSKSKGLIDKNIKQLNGKPMMAYSIEAAILSGLFDEIMVSTDSEAYASIAVKHGASVPFLRSHELSSDTATSWAVVKEVIEKYEEIGIKFDTVSLLQPTSPLRTAEDIKNGYDTFNKKQADLVVSVCEVDHSPLWSNTLPQDNCMEHFIDSSLLYKQRQNLSQYYRINGALYIVRVSHLMSSSNLYSSKSYAIIMDKKKSIDIDDELDFIIAQSILKLK